MRIRLRIYTCLTFLATLINLSCNQNNSKKTPDNCKVNSGKQDSTIKKKIPTSDSGKLPYPYVTEFDKLKNGYELVSMEVNISNDKGMRILLQHNYELKLINGWPSFGCHGGLEADFDSTFLYSLGCGSGNPKYLWLYEKKSCKVLDSISGFILKIDASNEVVVYDDRHSYNFVIADYRKNKHEVYKEPDDNHCICCDCWDFVKLTDSELVISYKDYKDKKQTITYKRNNANH